jgi:hypothetical protein
MYIHTTISSDDDIFQLNALLDKGKYSDFTLTCKVEEKIIFIWDHEGFLYKTFFELPVKNILSFEDLRDYVNSSCKSGLTIKDIKEIILLFEKGNDLGFFNQTRETLNSTKSN